MKVKIRPEFEIETVTKNTQCSLKCVGITRGGTYGRCNIFRVDLKLGRSYYPNRCQACLDAEKEGA
jgi:hypothetical protein